MKLKICGMREPENIRAVAALGPDYMGFIFYPLSPRYAGDLSPESVRALPRPIRRVGVFVNETEQQVIRTAVHYLLDYAITRGRDARGMPPPEPHPSRHQGHSSPYRSRPCRNATVRRLLHGIALRYENRTIRRVGTPVRLEYTERLLRGNAVPAERGYRTR
jgi:hypothetical protein